MNSWTALLLRTSIATTMIAYGVHQIARPVRWLSYVPQQLQSLLPMRSTVFMREHGAANTGLGVLFLLNVKPHLLYWAVLMWWLSILPFAFYEDWRTGMRDTIVVVSIIGLVVAACKKRAS